MKPEPRAPIWIVNRFQDCARHVHARVAHQEKHCEHWRHGVQLTDGDRASAEDAAGQQRQARFPPRFCGKDFEYGERAVSCDGAQKSGAGGQARQASADGRRHDAIEHDFLERPCGRRRKKLIVEKGAAWCNTPIEDDEREVNERREHLGEERTLRDRAGGVRQVRGAIAPRHDPSDRREPQRHQRDEAVLGGIQREGLLWSVVRGSEILREVSARWSAPCELLRRNITLRVCHLHVVWAAVVAGPDETAKVHAGNNDHDAEQEDCAKASHILDAAADHDQRNREDANRRHTDVIQVARSDDLRFRRRDLPSLDSAHEVHRRANGIRHVKAEADSGTKGRPEGARDEEVGAASLDHAICCHR
mmetsp:Transcript_101805/g.287184  ORF Transcript_101805/g.287184 Transcript_101805/m.287184 type:complete len:362 (-) Transcript_101805:314-1399(-)